MNSFETPVIEKAPEVDQLVLSKAARAGHESWRKQQSGKRIVGYPRNFKDEDSDLLYHPALLPFGLIMEIRKHRPMNTEKFKQWFLSRLVEYEKMGEISFLETFRIFGLLGNESWFTENFIDWMNEIGNKWALANDNWGENALVLLERLGFKEKVGQLSTEEIKILLQLKEEMLMFEGLQGIDSLIDAITNYPDIRNLMILVHDGWRRLKYEELTEFRSIRLVKEDELTQFDISELRIGLEKKNYELKTALTSLYSSADLNPKTQQNIQSFVTNFITSQRSSLESNKEYSSVQTFAFMIFIAEEIKSKLAEEVPDDGDFHRALGEELASIIWNIKMDVNPAIIDGILNADRIIKEQA